MRRRPSPALVVAFLALLVSASGVTYAAIPAKDGDIHACYSKKTGAIELIDTQRDRFTCEKNWKGLVIDTSPSRLLPPNIVSSNAPTATVEATNNGSRLVSPDGKFKVEATNDGARLVGPKGLIQVGTSKVSVTTDLPLEVTGGTTISVTGGSDVNFVSGKKLTVLSALDTNLTAGENLSIAADEQAHVRAKRSIFEGFVETRVLSSDLTLSSSGPAQLQGSGPVDLRGAVVRINGTVQDGN